MSSLDWGFIIGYCFFVTGIGLYFTKRANSSLEEYFLSGRNLPWWIAGSSMAASAFSVDTPLYVTNLVRKDGIAGNWQWWGLATGGMLSVFIFAPLWRRAHVLTDVELTEIRYCGRPASFLRCFRSIYLSLIINCLGMAAVLKATATIAQVCLGWDPQTAIPVFLCLVVFYALLSGFWGVVVTDFFQFIIAMAGSIMLAGFAVAEIGGITTLKMKLFQGGYGDFLSFFPPYQKVSVFSPDFWTPMMTAFALYVSVQWWAFVNADGGGKIVQRMSACKDERESLWATFFFNVSHYGFRTWPWIIVALASIVLLPELTNPELAYPKLMMGLLPDGMKGLMFASFLAAFMSTVDTQLNWGASYLVNDVYRRFIRPDKGEKHYILVSKISLVPLLLFTYLIAVVSPSVREVIETILAFGSGVGLVYILRWFWWRVNAWSEISAMIASSIVSCVLFYHKSYGAHSDPYSFPKTLFYTIVISTIVWIVVTFVTPPVEKRQLQDFWQRVRPGGFWGPIKADGFNDTAIGTGRDAFQWGIGVVFIFSITFSIGKFLLGYTLEGIFCALVASVSLFLIVCLYIKDSNNAIKK